MIDVAGGATDAVTLAAVVLAALLALIGALALIIFKSVLNSVNDIHSQLKQTDGRLHRLADDVWSLLWHLDEVEAFLENELNFRPPKLTKPRRESGD